MKKAIIFITISVLFTHNAISQENFKWDKILSIDGSQYELFLKGKKYISYNRGVQYSDEKNHVITAFLKTKARYEATSIIYNNLIFEYRLQILTKDNKVRVLIDNVICIERKYKGMPASSLYPGDQYELEMDRFYSVMKGLRDALNRVVIEIESELQKPLDSANNDW